MHLLFLSLHIESNYYLYPVSDTMKEELYIHNLSIEQIDTLIQQTWSILSDKEKKEFTDELGIVDEEYLNDIQTLIDNKFKD